MQTFATSVAAQPKSVEAAGQDSYASVAEQVPFVVELPQNIQQPPS